MDARRKEDKISSVLRMPALCTRLRVCFQRSQILSLWFFIQFIPRSWVSLKLQKSVWGTVKLGLPSRR